MPNLVVVAVIKAKEGSESAVKKGLAGLVEPTLREQGCLNYDLHTDQEDPTRFVFHETWASEADLDRHLESDHIKAFQKAGEGIIEEVEMYRLTRC